MKLGLVMEGGSMRGLFTAGVLDVMMENHLTVDAAIGVSAGACFGCNIKSSQIGRALRYNKRYANDWHYHSMRSLLLTGDIFNAQFCYETLPQKLDPFDREAFCRNPMEFRVVATDIDSGEPVYHLLTDGGQQDLQWIRASASVPLLSRPVALNDRLLLDGGVADSIPLAYHISIGYQRNIVILTRPSDYVKQPEPTMPLARIMLSKHPGIVHAMETRHTRYNESRELVRMQSNAGRAFVFEPPFALPVRQTEHDPQHLQMAYAIGRSEAEKRLEELKQFIDETTRA